MDDITLSEEFADNILPVTIFIGLLGCFGVVGNSCVLYVYKNKYPHCNFRYFVICLATIDLSSCLFVFPSEIYSQRNWFAFPKSAAWFCKVKISSFAVAVFTLAFILLLISIDRFRKVCRPLGWQIKPNIAVRLCVLIFGIALTLCIPVPFLYGIQTSNITYKGDTFEISSCLKDDKYKNTPWPAMYVSVSYYIPVITFMVTTMVLYALILKKILHDKILNRNQSKAEQHKKTVHNAAEDSLTEESMDTNESNVAIRENKCAAENSITYENTTTSVTNDSDSELVEKEVKSKDPKRRWKEPGYRPEAIDMKSMSTTKNVSSRPHLTTSLRRVRRKSLIMFVVTLIFNVTTLLYICILSVLYLYKHDMFQFVTMETAGLLFWFWRLYFVNHVINPLVYGLLDQRFKEAIKISFFQRKL